MVGEAEAVLGGGGS
jgi:hypothetical protein